MRIGVNTRLLLTGKMDGIGWFTTETMKRIVRSHPEHEFYFFFGLSAPILSMSFIFSLTGSMTRVLFLEKMSTR